MSERGFEVAAVMLGSCTHGIHVCVRQRHAVSPGLAHVRVDVHHGVAGVPGAAGTRGAQGDGVRRLDNLVPPRSRRDTRQAMVWLAEPRRRGNRFRGSQRRHTTAPSCRAVAVCKRLVRRACFSAASAPPTYPNSACARTLPHLRSQPGSHGVGVHKRGDSRRVVRNRLRCSVGVCSPGGERCFIANTAYDVGAVSA